MPSSFDSFETVVVERNEGITTLRLNRPEKRNAMSPTMHAEMHEALSELAHDDETKVLVITGTGESFCAGQDLKKYFHELQDSPRQWAESFKKAREWRHELLYNFPKPTIAAINGWCFGGAFTFVAACDIAIASDDATFGLSEINFGNIPGGLVSKICADLLIPRQALYYILTAETFKGPRATDIGFTTMNVPHDELYAKTEEVARVLMAKDPVAMKACKEAFKGVNLRAMSFVDAGHWLMAKVDQLTLKQKRASWLEKGIGDFMDGKFRPGLEARPDVKEKA